MRTTQQNALGFLRCGWSLVPVRADGSKAPIMKWGRYQSEKPSPEEVEGWFGADDDRGIALIHGQISGGSEVLDFDAPGAADEFHQLCSDHGLRELVDSLVHVQTPSGGWHLYWRCPDGVEGNQKLARQADGKVKIETRGEGGYTLAPGSPAACHPAGQLYALVHGKFNKVPVITADQRAALLAMARATNEYVEPEFVHRPTGAPRARVEDSGATPGDDYNQRVDGSEVLEMLKRHGWQCVSDRSGPNGPVADLVRPGKSAHDGISATLGYVGENVLYVFSSSAAPFSEDHGYKPFSVYGLLEHGGDFAAAARALGTQGYGAPLPQRVQLAIGKYDPAGEPKPKSLETPELRVVGPQDDDDEEWTGEDPAGAEDDLPPPSAASQQALLDEQCAAYPTTDMGNAERLVARHGDDLRWCPGLPEKWLVWDSRRFCPDEGQARVRRVKHAVRRILAEAAIVERQGGEVAEKRAKALRAHAIASEGARRISSALTLAESEPGIYVPAAELDRDPWLLTCLSGTIDLRTGKQHGHRREDLTTKLAPVVYDPSATAPTWEKFIRRVVPDDDLRGYIQRVMGYALTGSVEEQCLFFLYGSGSNGKTTLLETMRHLLGDYAHKAPSELLLASKDNAGARDDVAALQGRRFVVTAEIDEGRAMAEALMKQLTGGETVTARKLYANAVTFEPTWKIFLGANTKPVVRSANDFAVWRRIKLLPFTEKIAEHEKDEQLPAKLALERAGILNWMLAGLRDWRSGGLQEPAIVRDQVDAYRAESDTVGQFLDEMCVAQADARVRPAALYNAYVKWCEGRKERPKSLTIFGQSIQERGFERQKSHGYPTYIGLGLKTEEEGF